MGEIHPAILQDMRDRMREKARALELVMSSFPVDRSTARALADHLACTRLRISELSARIDATSDRLPSSTPPPAQRAAHGGTDERKAEAADLPRVKRAGQAIREGEGETDG